MTRKEFVLNVVEELKTNPRSVLAGHGINAAVLQTIVQRPDVMAKLAIVLYSTKYAKKGAKGLKKASNFVIKGYKNFPEFNLKAREDVENFIGGLSPDDAAKFTNADNILTILLLPEGKQTSDEETADSIISGKSIVLTFDSAVRKEYKIPGGLYLTVMIADSAARPAEVKTAERKEKINKKKNARRTPAKIKAELKSKATKKLEIIKRKNAALSDEAFSAKMELEQFSRIGQQFGATGKAATNIIGAINKYGAESAQAKAAIDAKIATLNPEQEKAYKNAMSYMKRGKKDIAKAFIKEIGDPELMNFVIKQGGSIIGADDKLASMKNELKTKIKALVAKNEEYLLNLSTTVDNNKKLSLKSMISKNNSAIKQLRAKLGTYKNLSVNAMRNKAKMLEEANATIEANIAKGATISQALNSAIAKLNATPSEKQIIKQQVIQQVSNGLPTQYAVQQAIQENIADVVDDTLLSGGSTTIEDILNKI